MKRDFEQDEEAAGITYDRDGLLGELAACSDVLADFLRYAEEMRTIGRGFVPADRHGRPADAVLAAAVRALNGRR